MSGVGRGRGAFFKAKYGGGGRGLGERSPPYPPPNQTPQVTSSGGGKGQGASPELLQILQRIDRRQYGEYKQLYGNYHFSETPERPEFRLSVEHIQADAFAPPSRFRALIPIKSAGFSEETYNPRIRKIALCDYITRNAHSIITRHGWENTSSGSGWSGPKGGDFTINAPSQQVLERTSCLISKDAKTSEKMLELRFTVGLPAAGRTILGSQAIEILTVRLPQLVTASMLWNSMNQKHLIEHIKSIEDQHALRKGLKGKNLVAFIGNGSILPRQSGVSALPMTGSEVVPFQSPPSLEVTIQTPNRGPVTGMGIPKGITVLSGGGFHGKSTLLEAIELGIYNHIPSDGREIVVTDDAVKIRAEDGRSVVSTDITPFIGVLPGGKTTDQFTSEDASGSTSMAANIQEAVELGASALLLDEDSCATNLLIRDQRMQALIQAEPITPLVAKVQSLFKDHDVSTIIVIGGCGDYLSVANLVIGMENYVPHDLTEKAREINTRYPITIATHDTYGNIPSRTPLLPAFHQNSKAPIVRGKHTIVTNITADVDISEIDQFVESGQVKTCAELLRVISKAGAGGPRAGGGGNPKTMREWARWIDETIEAKGMDVLHTEGWVMGDLVQVRGIEAMAVVNRVRGLKAKGQQGI
ncbi:hypothetical protein DFH27DRAFT_561689 [Peziza echinospora]|nr:hypothetical protein DFH27DRAFT_561689 [Peziza echinospora]